MDKGQTRRVSQAEIELFKQFVKSREDALLILRNHFLQLELDGQEKSFLSSLPKELLAALRKMLIPSLIPDVPLTQEATLFSSLEGIDQNHYELGNMRIEANDLVAQYLEQQWDQLTSDEVKDTDIKLSELPLGPKGVDQKELRVVNMIAHNEIIPLVEGRLRAIEALGNIVEETPEAQAKRLAADSAE